MADPPTFAEILSAPWKDADGNAVFNLKTYTLVRPTLGSVTGGGTDETDDPYVNSFTVTIQKLVEYYLVAVPEYYMWNIVQRYAGLYQNCAIEANELAVDECWQYAYIIRTIYLVVMSNLFYVTSISSGALFYSIWSNAQRNK